MESDRLETNLGPTAEYDVIPEIQPETKQPRRRFVGRRTAQQLNEEQGKQDVGDVEAGTSLQSRL